MKRFNTTGICKPSRHYMVDITERLEQIKELVDDGEYFVINRARQYGKTTTLVALKEFLSNEYIVVSLDFQIMMEEEFENGSAFTKALARQFHTAIEREQLADEAVLGNVKEFVEGKNESLTEFFSVLSKWCESTEKPIVLTIDEIDKASNYQVFLDFLSILRGYYLQREQTTTFHSVILAGLHDIKNLKGKIRLDESHQTNSPWNIAADFDVDMSLTTEGIMGMLTEYESDHNTGMNIVEMACLLHEYTSGYPFLVSRLCKILDEKISKYLTENTWTKQGFLEALKLLYREKNTLFDSLTHRLEENQNLSILLNDVLFRGKTIAYSIYNPAIELATIYGFVQEKNGNLIVANRIFEVVLYNLFLSTNEALVTEAYEAGQRDKNQFVRNGHLDMDLILAKFVQHYTSIYGNLDEKFLEEEGRKYFLLYLRPIINGTGNYYIEAQTRDAKRTDVIVDYNGEQFIIEMKIWHGEVYHQDGEQQLSDYLDTYGLKKGYMLTFNFNKNKEVGVKPINFGDKLLIEAIV